MVCGRGLSLARGEVLGVLAAAHVYGDALLHAAHAQPDGVVFPPPAPRVSPRGGGADVRGAAGGGVFRN